MKIITIFMALVALCMPALAETVPETAAYELISGETARTLQIPGAFSLELPVDWQEQPLSPEQTGAGVVACFSDGAHFVNLTCADDTGEFPDINSYAQSIAGSYDSVFVSPLGGADFACGVDTEALASDCAVLIPGAGVYAFRFYPTGDEAFAQTILDIMATFRRIEVTE